jgi:hypothetical protein
LEQDATPRAIIVAINKAERIKWAKLRFSCKYVWKGAVTQNQAVKINIKTFPRQNGGRLYY